jgi:hypothetical protein
LEEKRNQETEGMKDIITLPEYKIEIPNEMLHMMSSQLMAEGLKDFFSTHPIR